MTTTPTQSWTMDAGLPWKRMVAIKDRRTRRILKPTDVAGAIKTDAFGGLMPFTCTVTFEGSVMIELSAADTRSLTPGVVYEFDVVATVPNAMPIQSFETRKVLAGTIAVSAYSTITYGDEDVTTMELRFNKGEDFTRPFAWMLDGVLQQVQNAYLQVDDGTDVTQVDLRWVGTTVPNTAAIAAMPVKQRGYILKGALPGEDACTLTVRIDHTNSVVAGVYAWDLFVQDLAGDWIRLAKGSMYVDPATSENPYP